MAEPRHNFEAEQAVLGSILFDNAVYAELDFLRPESFADPLHGKLFASIGRMIDKGQAVSPVTLKSYGETDPDFRKVGGIVYLTQLALVAVPSRDAADYGRIVHELHIERQAHDVAARLHTGDEIDTDPMARIAETAERLGELASRGRIENTARPFAEAVERAVGIADAIYSRGGGLSGLSTGYAPIDGMLGGLHSSDLTILAARPAMGKTSLATGIGYNVAGDGLPVGFFSLEMTADQLAARVISHGASVPGNKIRQGTMTAAEMQRYLNAGNATKHLPLFIDDTGALSIATLRTRARRMKRAHDIRLLIVDYLQLLTGDDRRANRVEEVSAITRGLKALAKELGIPVLALSQLSRSVESRTDKRPVLSDLRESGSIEQDADAVLFLYRPEYYLERSDRAGSPEHIASMGQAEVIIAKQRHGPTGTVLLQFDGALTRFGNPGTRREAA